MLTFTTFYETPVVLSATADHETIPCDDTIRVGANLAIKFPLMQRVCNFLWNFGNKPASNDDAWPNLTRFNCPMVTAGIAHNSAPTND